MKSRILFIITLAALVSGTLGFEGLSHAQIRNGGLRSIASMFSVVEVPAFFNETQLQRIDALELDYRWPMPTDTLVAWPMSDGIPLVKTKRADELWHTLRPWQDTERLLEMYKGSSRRLRNFNPGVNFSHLLAGELLLMWERDLDVLSQSIGNANNGFLRNAELLPEGDNYKLLYPHRTFGTFYTVSEMVRVLGLLNARYPDSSQILIGDISLRLGGTMTPHASHTSGRDIDFSYPRDDEPATWKRFQEVNTRTINAPQTLFIVKALLDSDQVKMIFMDRKLQQVLVQEAIRQDAPREWIRAVFQYPYASGTPAIVRHSKGHINHMHVRFKCQPTDPHCGL